MSRVVTRYSKKRNIEKVEFSNILTEIIELLQREGYHNNYCIYNDENKIKIKMFDLMTQLGSQIISGHGKVFLIKYNNIILAVKIFIYHKQDNTIIEPQAKKELDVLNKIQEITINFEIAENIIHLPFIYMINECPIKLSDTDIRTIEQKFNYIDDIIKYNYKLIFTELAYGTLEDFIKNEFYKLTINNIYNTIAQIFFATYFFHTKIGYYHNDLHWGNMLYYKPINEILYNINGKQYRYKYTNMFLWKIWDFDTCTPIENNDIFIKDDYLKILSFFTNTLLPIYGMPLDAKIIKVYNNKSNIVYS